MERLLQKMGIEINIAQELKKKEEELEELKGRITLLKDLQAFSECFNSLSDFGKQEFVKLADVKGCKPYHTEGNALIHTFLVFREMREFAPMNGILQKAAFLHDIGKIYTGRPRKDDPESWEYPNHSGVGADQVRFFLGDKEPVPNAKIYEWYIRNHIKPLFWKKKGVIDTTPISETGSKYLENNCTVHYLALLAICDIRGSISTEPQNELEDFLVNICVQTCDKE
jgi:hypothetical protein